MFLSGPESVQNVDEVHGLVWSVTGTEANNQDMTQTGLKMYVHVRVNDCTKYE